jgi:hypothetical protein
VVVLLEDGDIFVEPVTNYYMHNMREFKTVLGTPDNSRILKLRGSFFAQQNQRTSVCAHASLRTAINSSFSLSIGKLTNKYINDTLNLVDYDPGKGLQKDQIEQVVRSLGFTFHSANFLENTSIEYDHFLYPALESGFPTILGLEQYNTSTQCPSGHVVTVLGHTINSDRWDPEAKRGYGNYPITPYISSAEWCCHYIISDDNYGMYSTMPTDSVRNFIVPSKNPNQHVGMAIVIVPQKIELPGYNAEQSSVLVAGRLVNSVKLKKECQWLNRMKGRPLVCRTILQSKEQYKSYIQKYASGMGSNPKQCIDSLPEYIWVTEVSLPNILTGNKDKLGDVLLNAASIKEECLNGKALAMAWFPGFVQLGSQLNIETWPIETHVPLIRNTKPPFLEW